MMEATALPMLLAMVKYMMYPLAITGEKVFIR